MATAFGLEVLLENKKLVKELKSKRVALVCHPASVDKTLQHSFEVLQKKIGLACAFGPQHGVNGEKQDNMVESATFIHPDFKIPIYSLYGEVRIPSKKMMDSFDILLFDLQDLGCRIYTFITTLLYVMQECAKNGKAVIVLDRPNPAGRPIEGFALRAGWESFVGAANFPMRHGLTCGEMALFYKDHFKLDLDLRIVKMKGYSPLKNGGWPAERCWVNPSPNAATLNMARIYCGSVLIEGTNLSEGRGTTRALEQLGAGDIDFKLVLSLMRKKAPQWMKGVYFRECYFEPTFHKFEKKLCHGFQIHTDFAGYKADQFKPFRAVALMLKCVRELYPNYKIYRDFAYEYTVGKLAFDVINGGPELRNWIEDSSASVVNLDKTLKVDEAKWSKRRKKYLLY